MISLKDAQKIIEGCLKKARDENLKPITIAVLDSRGILVSSAMEDNSSLIRPDIAFAKASQNVSLWPSPSSGAAPRWLSKEDLSVDFRLL